ncbi:MAG: hypothetical protein ACXW2E_00490 [Nitrososphaeraceae archaeon]
MINFLRTTLRSRKTCLHCKAINKQNYGEYNIGWNQHKIGPRYRWGWLCRECGKVEWDLAEPISVSI